MRILVCDDESEIRNIIRILLESSGYEVVEAESRSLLPRPCRDRRGE